MIDWLLIPRNAAILNWVSFVFGGLGLALALLGLKIALNQLKGIKSETEAAKAAIDSVQVRVAAFDTAEECQSARSLIRSIHGHLHAQEWQNVVLAYEKLIESFLRLSHSNSSISQEDRLLLQKMTRDMASICDGIRKRSGTNSHGSVVLRGQDQALRDFSDIMTKITFAVARNLQQ
ncbi:MAG: hypothetical protein E6G94_02310 [Alphaproteobacteria bacterium]|nr:MAG: hypothetical protein E6G94_02310 [Alphaproteobacteria bacterium]